MSEVSKHEIERELEQDRVALAQSLVTLRDRLHPANLVAEGKDVLMAQASPMGLCRKLLGRRDYGFWPLAGYAARAAN